MNTNDAAGALFVPGGDTNPGTFIAPAAQEPFSPESPLPLLQPYQYISTNKTTPSQYVLGYLANFCRVLVQRAAKYLAVYHITQYKPSQRPSWYH